MKITTKLKENKLLKNFLRDLLEKRAAGIVKEIEKYLDKNDRIIDIGAGSCVIAEALTEKHYNVTPIDVEGSIFANKIKSIIFDGDKIPFGNNQFTAALIITVLHHVLNNEKLVKEAIRVASKKIIIIEDIYTGPIHKRLTFFMDSLVNVEFRGHPHTNRSDKEWKELFKELGLNLKDAKYRKSRFPFLYHATYYLEK